MATNLSLAQRYAFSLSRTLMVPVCVSACNFDPLRRGIGVQF